MQPPVTCSFIFYGFLQGTRQECAAFGGATKGIGDTRTCYYSDQGTLVGGVADLKAALVALQPDGQHLRYGHGCLQAGEWL